MKLPFSFQALKVITAATCMIRTRLHRRSARTPTPTPTPVSKLRPWRRQSAHCATCPFTLSQAPAANQTVPCKLSSKTAWARRATDPAQHSSVLDTAGLPDPSIYLQPHNGTCNSYLPDTNGLGRLLWTVKYLVANGMYVVVSRSPRELTPLAAPLLTPAYCTPSTGCHPVTVRVRVSRWAAQRPPPCPVLANSVLCAALHPSLCPAFQLSYKPVPGETVHQDRDVFALAWLSLWTPITCLDNFSADIRGRLMLDLLNEPSRLNGGIGWRWAG